MSVKREANHFVVDRVTGTADIVVGDAGLRHSVLVTRCSGNVRVSVPNKVGAVVLEHCTGGVTLDVHSVITAVECVHCRDVSLHVRGRVATVVLDLSENVTIVVESDVRRTTTLVTSSTANVRVESSDGSWSTLVPDVFRVVLEANGTALSVHPAPELCAAATESVRSAALTLASAITLERLGSESPLSLIDSFVIREIVAALAAETALEEPDDELLLLPAQKLGSLAKIEPVRVGRTLIIEGHALVPRTRTVPVCVNASTTDRLVFRRCSNFEVLIKGAAESLTVEGCVRLTIDAPCLTNGAVVRGCKDVGILVGECRCDPLAPPPSIGVAFSSSIQLAIPPNAQLITKHAEAVNVVGVQLPGGELAVPNQFRTVIELNSDNQWTATTKVLRRP